MYPNNYQSQMQSQQPPQRSNYMQPMYQQSFLKGRQVSSLEEVRATGIDFDGSVFYFPDIANKRIYTKQIMMDGSAQLLMYELKPIPSEIPPMDYITREEFVQAINQLQESFAAATAQQPQEPNEIAATIQAAPQTTTAPLNF